MGRSMLLLAVAGVASAEPCKYQKMPVLTQTLEGEGVMTVKTGEMKIGNTTVPARTMYMKHTITEAIDYEKFNMVVKQHISVEDMPGMDVQQDMIVNWEKGLAVHHTKQMGKEMCKTIQLPSPLRYLPMGPLLKKLSSFMSGFYKCVDHQNDLDKFETNMNFPPAHLPPWIKLGGDWPELHMSLTAGVNADGLLKSVKVAESIKLNVSLPQGTVNSDTETHEEVTFTKSQLGGPSQDDLSTPAEWGDCSTVHMPTLTDLLAEWEGKDSPFKGHTKVFPHMLKVASSGSKALDAVMV